MRAPALTAIAQADVTDSIIRTAVLVTILLAVVFVGIPVLLVRGFRRLYGDQTGWKHLNAAIGLEDVVLDHLTSIAWMP